MSKEVANRNGGTGVALPADFVGKLSSGIAESRSQTHIPGGKPFLRLQKDGTWVYGAEDVEVEDGSTWCVNVMSLAHGWSCWVEKGQGQKNELMGEVMASMTEPCPARPAAIQMTEFQQQRAFDLKCMDGEDDGTEVQYKTASVGGMRAVDGLLAAIQKALVEHPQRAFPVIKLEQDHYSHTKWGKIYTPIFSIVGWADMNGNVDDERPAVAPPTKTAAPAPAPEPEPEPAPRARRKAAGKATPEPTPEPRSTAQAHRGGAQRRRPGR